MSGKSSSFNYNQGTPSLTRDYNFFNVIDSEQFSLKGVPIFYFKISDIQPNYDILYRDFVSDPVYDYPIEVRAICQIEENTQHGMTDTGIGQIAERTGTVNFNISMIERTLGRPPILGDVVYFRQFNQRFQIYQISKDAYKLSFPLRYTCKVRLYQDTNSTGTSWTFPEERLGPNVVAVTTGNTTVFEVSLPEAAKIAVDPISGLPGDVSVQDALETLAVGYAVNKVTLGQITQAYTCYRINVDRAYIITSIDSTLPEIDGITLTPGVTNDIVDVANIQGKEYMAGVPYLGSDQQYLYLGQNGQITLTPPSKAAGDVYALIVGRTIQNTNKFILDPKMSIRLI